MEEKQAFTLGRCAKRSFGNKKAKAGCHKKCLSDIFLALVFFYFKSALLNAFFIYET